MLATADKENIEDEDEPLYIDKKDNVIKCFWCKQFCGSKMLKHVNQHTRKSVSHLQARKEKLRQGDGQNDIRNFLIV